MHKEQKHRILNKEYKTSITIIKKKNNIYKFGLF